MNKRNAFWTFVEHFKLLIEFALLVIAVAPVIWAGVLLLGTGLAAVVPAWSVLVATIATLLLGYLIGRGPNIVLGKQKKSIIRREFYSVLWDFDTISEQVNGPFCKTCHTMMIPKYSYDLTVRPFLGQV